MSSLFTNNDKPEFIKSFMVIFSILTLIQISITFFESPSKRISKSAIIRNIIIATLCSYSFVKYGLNIFMSLLFFIISILIHFVLTLVEAKTLTMPIDDYVTVTYIYDICFPKLYNGAKTEQTKKTLNSFTEGLFKEKDVGLDLDDLSQENINRVYEYIETTYKNQTKHYFENNNPDVIHIPLPNGDTTDMTKVESDGQINKFDWFLSFVPDNVDKSSIRILELGFGEGNFLRHARNKGFKHIVGVNVSQEQVDHAKNDGFEVYCKNFWELNDLKLKPFDFIFANGSLEYVLPKTANTIFAPVNYEAVKYEEFYKIINDNLNPNGVFCNTMIHVSDNFKLPYDNFNFWTLWLGNSGNYPSDASTKKALKNAGFETVVYKDATLHYAYWSLIWTLCVNSANEMSFFDGLRLSMASPFYIFSQMCYASIPRIFGNEAVFRCHSWLQQFIPRNENGNRIYGSQIANHRWIVTKKI